jgi:carotenoid phi-ring synthase / carotenoid chi-ring synthase
VTENPSPIIIGGGVAGLTAALHLAERGLHPRLLEAHPQFVGGRIAGGETISLTHKGQDWHFRQEHGVHGIWNPYVNLKATLARHTLTPDFVPAIEETWLYKHNDRLSITPAGSLIRYSWIAAPLHYLMLFLHPRFLNTLGLDDWASLLHAWSGILYGLAVDPFAEDQPLDGQTLADLTRTWSPALRAFVTGLTRNGMAAPPDEVPLSGFLAFLRFYTLLRRDNWQFSYLPTDGGAGMVEPMMKKIIQLGGTVQLNTRVTHLEQCPDGWQIHIQTGSTLSESLTTTHVILATDSPAARRILTQSTPIAAKAKQLFFPRGMASAVIRIWFDHIPNPTSEARSEAGMFTGDFVLHNYFWLHRIQEQYRIWHRSTGGSCIEVHIYGPQPLLNEPEGVLLARAITDVQTVFPELRGRRLHQTIQRNNATHTLFGLGPHDKHLGIRTPWSGLYCAGDWVRHSAPAFFLERACLTGIEAANAVLTDRDLPPFPLQPYPSPEPFAAFIERLMRRGRKQHTQLYRKAR